MRVGDLGQRVGVELDAGLLHLAQHVHERQLDVVMSSAQPALGELLALPGGELVDEHRARGGRRPRVGGDAALLGELVERVAAAGGVEQVGGDSVSKTRFGGTSPSALASWAMTGRSPARRRRSAGRPRSPASPRRRRPRRRSASAARAGSARPRAARARCRRARAPRPSSRRCRPGVPSRTRRRRARRRPRGAGSPRRRARERLLEAAQRVAQLPVAEDLAQVGAVGLARDSASRSMSIGHVARHRRELLGEPRGVGVLASGSACAWRRRSRRRGRARSSRSPKRCSSSAAVLSPMPGTPGMLSQVSPLRPMKSGISSGGMP